MGHQDQGCQIDFQKIRNESQAYLPKKNVWIQIFLKCSKIERIPEP